MKVFVDSHGCVKTSSIPISEAFYVCVSGLFCRLYALVLLVASRHEVSIEMDKEEMLRIMSKSKVMSIVGKVRCSCAQPWSSQMFKDPARQNLPNRATVGICCRLW